MRRVPLRPAGIPSRQRAPRAAAALLAALLVPAAGRLPAQEPAPAAPAAPAPAPNLPAHTRWVISADYTADGGQLLTSGGESLLYRTGDAVIWNAADGNRAADLAGHPTAVWAIEASHDGRFAATAGYDGQVKLWDLPGRALKADLKKHKGWVRALDFSPDGTKLATAGEDGTVVVWDTGSNAEIRTIAAHSGPVTTVAFSPDGATLATGGGDKLVKLWDVAGGAEKGKLEGHGDTLWVVAYSPDGTKLATAGADRTIKLWNTADSKEIGTLAGHKDWVTTLAFTPDNARLASASLDGAVKFWDVASRAEQKGPPAPEGAKPSSVWCVAIHPAGQTMFVGSHAGGRIVPVPAPELAPVPPPPPPPSPVFAALAPAEFKSAAGATGAVAPDGAVLVTGSLAKDVYTIKAVVPPGGNVRQVKLEALADPSLPAMGPGRAGNGNLVVSRFALAAGAPGATDAPNVVKFAGVTADVAQEGYPAAATLDDNPETGWAIGPEFGKDHSLTFDVAPEVALPPGSVLVFTIEQQFADGTHNLGKFRISVLQAPPEPAK
ncbi:MAG: WD40 repeat domain-containing protein [Planctomycetaceae bacterium]